MTPTKRCKCGCGEWVDHRGRYATPACRTRAYRARRRERERPPMSTRARWRRRIEESAATSEDGGAVLRLSAAEVAELVALVDTDHRGQVALPLG